MIAYDDLCRALDRYNRRLRGEVVPNVPAHGHADSSDFDIMEEAEVEPDMEMAHPPPYPQGTPDVTAETYLPEGSVAPDAYPQQGYDPSAYPQQGQPQTPGSGPTPGVPHPGGNDPYRQ